MDYQNLDDEALLRLISRSHEAALSEFYDRYSRLVYSMAFNVTGDAEVAQEITQDVFLRVWEKADTYRAEQGKVATWLVSITRHRAIDLLRRARIRPEGNRAVWMDELEASLPNPTAVEGEAEQSQRQQMIRHALAQLPEEQRLALSYAFFQGYSHSEIARLLNQPLGTIKTRIRLAMQKLRQILQDVNGVG